MKCRNIYMYSIIIVRYKGHLFPLVGSCPGSSTICPCPYPGSSTLPGSVFPGNSAFAGYCAFPEYCTFPEYCAFPGYCVFPGYWFPGYWFPGNSALPGYPALSGSSALPLTSKLENSHPGGSRPPVGKARPARAGPFGRPSSGRS